MCIGPHCRVATQTAKTVLNNKNKFLCWPRARRVRSLRVRSLRVRSIILFALGKRRHGRHPPLPALNFHLLNHVHEDTHLGTPVPNFQHFHPPGVPGDVAVSFTKREAERPMRLQSEEGFRTRKDTIVREIFLLARIHRNTIR